MKFSALVWIGLMGSLGVLGPNQWAHSKVTFEHGPSHVCDFYLHKSDQLGCDKNGYLIQFGYRYCRIFEESQDLFTSQGLLTLAKIRPCLIRELEGTPELSCQNVKSIALDSHVRCYLKNGFCQMEWTDQLAIAYVVWQEVFDPEFAAVMSAIEDGCAVKRSKLRSLPFE